MKNSLCIWRWGRKTGNRSRICDHCWKDRESIYQARKAAETAKAKNPNRVTAGKRARMAAVGLDLTATGLSRVPEVNLEALP